MVEVASRWARTLVEEKLLTEEQLKKALDFQKSVGGRLSAIVVKLGFVSDQTLTQFMARKQGLPIAELENLVVPENLVKRIPQKLIEKHEVVPVAFRDGVLTIATSDPLDFDAIEEIQLVTGYRTEIALAPRSSIARTIQQIVNPEPTTEELVRELETKPQPAEAQAEAAAGKEAAKGAPKVLAFAQLNRALIPLLVEKGIISEEELRRKAVELGFV